MEPSSQGQARGGGTNYKPINSLGAGAFGEAILVRDQDTNRLAVIKKIDLTGLSKMQTDGARKEAKIMRVLQHPNIVGFREVYKTRTGKLCIVMDFVDGGDLNDMIRNKRRESQTADSYEARHFSEERIVNIFTQVCLAVKHMHDRRILHRDIKGKNIFMTKTGIAKLGDFGVSSVLNSHRSRAKTMCGTPHYIAPEIFSGETYKYEADIWSLGVLLYELCCLKLPFNGRSPQEIARTIMTSNYMPIP